MPSFRSTADIFSHTEILLKNDVRTIIRNQFLHQIKTWCACIITEPYLSLGKKEIQF